VVVDAVGADDVAAGLDRLVEDHLHAVLGAEEAGGPRQLVLLRGAEALAERVGELDLADVVGTPRPPATASIVVWPGVCSSPLMASGSAGTGCASAVAISRLAE
jgi:hypothetical protein